MDLDGDLDVLIGNTVGNSLFFENTGTAASPAFATPIANPHGLVQVQLNAAPALADIDADGDLDAFVGNRWGRVVSFRNLGTPGAPAFLGPVTNPFGLTAVGNLAAPALADVDGDGDFDAFVGDQAGDTSFFENTGSATAPAFASPLTNPFGLVGVEGPASPALADIDADGDFDLFVGSNGGSTSFFENVGTNAAPSFAAPVPNAFGLADVEALAAPAFADIDGDGDLDAFFGDAVGNTSFFENTGTATAPAFAAPATNPFGLADVEDAAAPFFADVDGDGDLDGFSGHLGAPVPGQGSVVFFENTGTAATPAFAAPLTDPFGLIQLGAYVHPAFVDLDGDGDLDAFFGEGGGNTVFFENLDRGSGTCADGIDNDFDGLADAGADAGCASAADPDERSAIGCDDGIDNDLDGKLDWRGDGTGDPDCTSLLDGTEAVPPGWACGLGPELGLLLPAFTWLSRRRIRARDAPRAIA